MRQLKGDKAITEHLAKHGYDKCPFCDSTNISASNYDGEHGELTCDVSCEECQSEWTEGYQFRWASVKLEPSGVDQNTHMQDAMTPGESTP